MSFLENSRFLKKINDVFRILPKIVEFWRIFSKFNKISQKFTNLTNFYKIIQILPKINEYCRSLLNVLPKVKPQPPKSNCQSQRKTPKLQVIGKIFIEKITKYIKQIKLN